MDKIQSFLIKIGRKDLAKEYFFKIKKADLNKMSYEDMVEVMRSLKKGDNIMIVADTKNQSKKSIMLQVKYNVSGPKELPTIGIELRRGRAVHPSTMSGAIMAYSNGIYWQPTMLTQVMPVYAIDKL